MFLTPAQEQQEDALRDKDSGEELKVVEKMPLLEWLAENYKKVRACKEQQGYEVCTQGQSTRKARVFTLHFHTSARLLPHCTSVCSAPWFITTRGERMF